VRARHWLFCEAFQRISFDKITTKANSLPTSSSTIPSVDAQYELVLEGHASMWGEHVDGSNFMSRVWSRRASAMAERLWTGTAREDTISDRMDDFRCHMVRRGIDAGSIGPGVCDKEPRFNKNAASIKTANLRPVNNYDNE
jgi:hypothetical protein